MKKVLALSLFSIPFLSFAAETANEGNLTGAISTIGGAISALIPIAFSLALVFFFYGLAIFILKTGEDKDNGKSIMIWGTVAMFIMASIFGIISFIGSTLGISTAGESTFKVPTVQSGAGGASSR